jgi:hypothetical protein
MTGATVSRLMMISGSSQDHLVEGFTGVLSEARMSSPAGAHSDAAWQGAGMWSRS